jgi:hypothetical protein
MSNSRRKAAKKGRSSSGDSRQQPTTQAVLFANESSFQNLAVHGNVSWTAVQLVTLAVLWAWSDRNTLTAAFKDAQQLARNWFGTAAVNSYPGLTWALRAYTDSLLALLWPHLHVRMEQAAKEHWRIGLWLALAVDGSRITTPRTVSNELAFAIKNYGRGRKTKSRIKWKNKRRRSKRLSEPVKPQIWLTLIWHMGLKLPWSWRTGPSTASERAHLLEMLDTQQFPEFTLFCGDAGFVGYEFWNTIHSHGHHFMVRVGANVRLLKNLGAARCNGNLVYLWPAAVARKKQPPLVLRLIRFEGVRGPVFLVTNVLQKKMLSERQAADLYRLRWGVELQFRTLKQTFGRTKLRSRTADNALIELHWSLVGLTLIQLFAVKEQIRVDIPPVESSVALALGVIQEAMRNWSCVVHDPNDLARRFQAATKDGYERRGSKKARYRPSCKDKPCATRPVIVLASRQQRHDYQAILAA